MWAEVRIWAKAWKFVKIKDETDDTTQFSNFSDTIQQFQNLFTFLFSPRAIKSSLCFCDASRLCVRATLCDMSMINIWFLCVFVSWKREIYETEKFSFQHFYGRHRQHWHGGRWFKTCTPWRRGHDARCDVHSQRGTKTLCLNEKPILQQLSSWKRKRELELKFMLHITWLTSSLK